MALNAQNEPQLSSVSGEGETLLGEQQLSLFSDGDRSLIDSIRQQRTGDLATNTAEKEGTRPLKICISGYRSAPFGGGQGIYIKYLSKALVEAGHSVDVISGQPYPELDKRVKLIKLPGLDLFTNGLLSVRPRHVVSLTNIIEWLSKLTGGFGEPYCFSRRLYQYLTAHRDDYDIIHDNQCLGWDMLKIQRDGFCLLTTIHHPITSDLQIALNASDHWWEKILIRRWHSFLTMQKKVAAQLNNIVTVSERSYADIIQSFNLKQENIKLIYNGIDTDEFKPLANTERDRWQIMATASADQPLKGLRFLLLAFSQLTKKYPELHLLLVSKPKIGGETETLIAQLGIGDKIKFVHGISTSAMVEHYAKSSIAVVPSIYEGFGLPAGEAMACGVPVIATDGGALPEVVGQAGLTVAVKDADAIAAAIEKLLSNPKAREQYGQLGRKRIENNFSWQLAADQISVMYCQIIDAQPKADIVAAEQPKVEHANG